MRVFRFFVDFCTRLGSVGGQFWVFEASRPFGTLKNVIWSKFFFEKNVFFGPQLAQIAHKMAQIGSVWGVWEVNFGVLRPPDPLGP